MHAETGGTLPIIRVSKHFEILGKAKQTMFSRRAAPLLLSAMVFLGGQNGAQAQASFEKPAAVDEFGLMPPTPDQLFRLQSEQALKERLRQELLNVKKVDFPGEGTPLRAITGTDAVPFPDLVIAPVAGQVCYRPLYFENKWTERFGYYVPCVQPLLSAGLFYGNVLLLPYHWCKAPPWTFQCDNP